MKVTLNKDNDIVNQIIKSLKENDGYCPCSLVKKANTKCMCKNFREQTTEGFCHCGLYYKLNN